MASFSDVPIPGRLAVLLLLVSFAWESCWSERSILFLRTQIRKRRWRLNPEILSMLSSTLPAQLSSDHSKRSKTCFEADCLVWKLRIVFLLEAGQRSHLNRVRQVTSESQQRSGRRGQTYWTET